MQLDSSNRADRSIGRGILSHETELIDRVVTDLGVYPVPASVESAWERNDDSIAIELDDPSLHDELVDAVLGQLIDELL